MERRLDGVIAQYDNQSQALRSLLRDGLNARGGPEGDYRLAVDVTDVEARIIANRLLAARNQYDDTNADGDHIATETVALANRFRRAANEASDNGETFLTVPMTGFEARIAGNRLWQVSNTYQHDHMRDETRWLARRFHVAAGIRDRSE